MHYIPYVKHVLMWHRNMTNKHLSLYGNESPKREIACCARNALHSSLYLTDRWHGYMHLHLLNYFMHVHVHTCKTIHTEHGFVNNVIDHFHQNIIAS